MNLIVRHFGIVDYSDAHANMRAHVEARSAADPDEIWLLQHERVFTQGQGGRAEHVLAPGDIPVVQSDRGGQVTYHGPGQLIAYVMLDLRRVGIGPRELVRRLEAGVIGTLAALGVDAARRDGAPGVYVGPAKIAALGLRIRRGLSFHGLSLNVDPDLSPFERINPCGYSGLAVTSLAELGVTQGIEAVATCLVPQLAGALYGHDVAVEPDHRHDQFDPAPGRANPIPVATVIPKGRNATPTIFETAATGVREQ